MMKILFPIFEGGAMIMLASRPKKNRDVKKKIACKKSKKNCPILFRKNPDFRTLFS